MRTPQFNRQPSRLRRASKYLLVSLLLALSFAVPAPAATDLYFNDGPIAYTEEVYDTRAHNLTLSYAHNLTDGETMCAGAHGYAGYSCQGSVSTYPYEGTHNIKAGIFSLAGGVVRENGHGDY
jgi:hypothetical protein